MLALVMFFGSIKNYAKKMFRVFSFLIYKIISNYVCIDCLGSEKPIKLFTFWCCRELQTS